MEIDEDRMLNRMKKEKGIEMDRIKSFRRFIG